MMAYVISEQRIISDTASGQMTVRNHINTAQRPGNVETIMRDLGSVSSIHPPSPAWAATRAGASSTYMKQG